MINMRSLHGAIGETAPTRVAWVAVIPERQ
jgi:hypothetical protein